MINTLIGRLPPLVMKRMKAIMAEYSYMEHNIYTATILIWRVYFKTPGF